MPSLLYHDDICKLIIRINELIGKEIITYPEECEAVEGTIWCILSKQWHKQCLSEVLSKTTEVCRYNSSPNSKKLFSFSG